MGLVCARGSVKVHEPHRAITQALAADYCGVGVGRVNRITHPCRNSRQSGRYWRRAGDLLPIVAPDLPWRRSAFQAGFGSLRSSLSRPGSPYATAFQQRAHQRLTHRRGVPDGYHFRVSGSECGIVRGSGPASVLTTFVEQHLDGARPSRRAANRNAPARRSSTVGAIATAVSANPQPAAATTTVTTRVHRRGEVPARARPKNRQKKPAPRKMLTNWRETTQSTSATPPMPSDTHGLFPRPVGATDLPVAGSMLVPSDSNRRASQLPLLVPPRSNQAVALSECSSSRVASPVSRPIVSKNSCPSLLVLRIRARVTRHGRGPPPGAEVPASTADEVR